MVVDGNKLLAHGAAGASTPVDTAARLGRSPNGTKDVMAHPYFASIDWERLLAKELPPPFPQMSLN